MKTNLTLEAHKFVPVIHNLSANSLRIARRVTDELLASDLLVIATPTWNFGIVSSLKAWIDLVVRPGKTLYGQRLGAGKG